MRILVLRETKSKKVKSNNSSNNLNVKPKIFIALDKGLSGNIGFEDTFENVIKIYSTVTELYLDLKIKLNEFDSTFRDIFLEGISSLIKNRKLPKNSYTIYRTCCTLFKGLEGNPNYVGSLRTHPIKREGKFSIEDTYKRKFRLGNKNIKIFQSYFSKKNSSRVYWLMSPDESNKLIIIGYVPNHPNNSNEKIYSRIVSDFSDYRNNLIQIDTGNLPPDNSKALIEQEI